MAKYSPKSKEELEKLVNNESVNLGDIDTSAIDDMSELFQGSKRTDFSGIENWDTSNVENMDSLFCDAKYFNHNINDWNVSSVINMRNMFERTPFNQPLDKWNVASVLNMVGMFANAKQFNQNIGMWDISRVERMESMFLGAESFNQNLDNWIPYKRAEIACIFSFCPIAYNPPEWFWYIHDRFFEWWDSVDNDWEEVMESEYDGGTYTPKDLDELRNLVANKFIHLGNIDTSAIDNMDELFIDSDRVIFDGIEKWNTSNVTYMGYVFSGAKHFNHNINDWNVSNVTDMQGMFESTPFNQSLDKWDTSNVKCLIDIFKDCPLKANPPKWYRKNKKVDGKTIYCPQTQGELEELVNDESVNLGDIDTSAITDMSGLFENSKRADFSGIEKWNVSNVENMMSMFEGAENFDKDISAWNVDKVKEMHGIFYDICDRIKLPSWYLKWVENNNDEILGHIYNADAICKQLKVAYIVKVDCDDDIEEVLEKYPSRLQATWELKDRYENGELDDDNEFFAVIGYEPKEISVKDLEPLVGMYMECADWLLRKGIRKAILFDNTDGLSYDGTIGKIFGVFATRLEAIERYTENEYPDEWWNLTTGEMQSLGYQPYFEVETFIGKDYMNLAEALRWVEWLKWGWKTYWWVEAYQHDGEIIRIVKKIDGDFDEAEAYKKELPLVKEGNAYILIGDSGKWIDAYGDENDE